MLQYYITKRTKSAQLEALGQTVRREIFSLANRAYVYTHSLFFLVGI